MSASNKFNIGRDATLVLVRPGGQIIRSALLTNFTFRQETAELKSRPLNGPPLHEYLPDGWTGTFEYDRADSSIDDYFTLREGVFYAGGSLESVLIRQTVRELGGGTSQYRFDQVSLRLEDGGSWKSDDRVQVRVGWWASQRTKGA